MIANLTPYPDMKDSGVKWLGLIPEHWEILRGKVLFSLYRCRSATPMERKSCLSQWIVRPWDSAEGVSTAVTMFKAESYVGHRALLAWGSGHRIAYGHGAVGLEYLSTTASLALLTAYTA